MLPVPWILIIVSAAAGAALAWLTLRLLRASILKMHLSQRPQIRLFLGFMMRMMFLCGIFYLLLRQGPWPAVFFLAGFWITRQWIIKYTLQGKILFLLKQSNRKATYEHQS